MTTLIINLSDSKCGGCGRSCLPTDVYHTTPCGYDNHAGCGVKFTHVSSNYNDFNGLYDNIKRMRPDLEFVDFWADKGGGWRR